MNAENLQSIRQAFYEQEDIERQDPKTMQLRFILHNVFEDPSTGRQVHSPRQIYNMFIDKSSTIHDLKSKIGKEFGFGLG